MEILMMSIYIYYLINVGCGIDYDGCGCKSERFGEILWETLAVRCSAENKSCLDLLFTSFRSASKASNESC